LAYSVYSYHSAHIDSGMFIIYVGTAPGQTKEALNVTLDVLEKIRTGEISEAELARGKEQLKGNLILSLESSGSRMNRMGKNELLVGRHYSLDEMIGRIDAVTADDVRNVIGMMFSRPFAVALVGGSDLPIRDFRRDQFVVSGKDQKIAGQ
jgi:predicted Zn-dependent peptidase